MRRAPRSARAWTPLAGLLAGLVVTTVTAGPAAAADEVHVRPADGVFTLEGRGYGHGRGMSQWGAQGAASQGVSAETIVSTYYPGTARAVLPASSIRVQLSADEGRDTAVVPAPGLAVRDVATGALATLPEGPTRWRVALVGGSLQVQSLTGTTWSAYAVGGSTALAGPVRFGGPELVRVVFPNGTSRDYRGVVQAVRTSSTALATVVVLDLEDYLLGVVPREAPASWRPAALQAQAIAARTYSAYKRSLVRAGAHWDICDTTACQVFGGTRSYTASGARTELEPASTTAAVRATAGVIRTYAGKPVLAEFSSSNGGWSAPGGPAYQVARKDEWDGVAPNSVHAWQATISAADLEKRFPAVGRLARIRVVSRNGHGDWGGRVLQVVLEGTSSTGAATRVTTTGEAVRFARSWPTAKDGLKSSWWRITNDAAPRPTPSATATPTPTAAKPAAARPAATPAPAARRPQPAFKGVAARVLARGARG